MCLIKVDIYYLSSLKLGFVISKGFIFSCVVLIFLILLYKMNIKRHINMCLFMLFIF
jgi:hypothetical protein